jgi:hypothetical protein
MTVTQYGPISLALVRPQVGVRIRNAILSGA